MKHLLFALTMALFGAVSGHAHSQSDMEGKLRADINAEFNRNISKCGIEVDVVTDFGKKKEFWRICHLDNNNRIIKIESHSEDTYYQEAYFERNGSLVYAAETERYMPKNHFTQQVWHCEFYISNGKLVTMMSLGHGKTERDDWDPNIIFEMYKDRLNELKRIKK